MNKTVSDRDNQLKTLKESAGDNEALKQQITQLQTENSTAKESFQKESDKLKFNSALELKIASSGAKNPTALSNAIELIRQLMSEYKIPISNIVRHYDITGKLCPKPYVNNADWNTFIKKIEGGNDEMTEQERKQFEELKARVKILEEKNIVYNWTEACPKWSQPYVQKALDLGWIKGDENGFLGLTDDMIRTLVIMLRKEGIMQ